MLICDSFIFYSCVKATNIRLSARKLFKCMISRKCIVIRKAGELPDIEKLFHFPGHLGYCQISSLLERG